MTIRPLLLAALLALSAPLVTHRFVAPAAHASHYRLPIDNLISTAEADALAKGGVTTTLALLEAVTTQTKRASLAKKTGLPLARIDALAAQVDLIRIEGIGPGVVRLMQASGVAHSRALATADASALHAKLTAVNASAKILGVIPPEGLVAAWISKAKSLPQAVEGLR
jgi:predicted flap endonuclease-1-like 5' DNA nuclease